ncbi:uncharacterized protein [Drosophila takahashii]|uniref:uncharacterized protein n=1 Tax=Drosophila takahashii TaxID=29030 RepID=UPI0038990A60
MCIHCCRLRRTPCPPIPYSCPHCPVRTISSCCPLGSRPFAENPFVRGRDREPPPDPCVNLPPRWLEVNRRVIYALANHLDRSPEAAHYILLRLLYANYGKVMMISRKRRSFRVPLTGFPDQDLFSTSTLFDNNGYLSDPMAPETLGKLLHMMQDYIFRLRALNRKYKWFGNGEDLGEILPLLGEQDELVRLLRELFGDSDVVSIPKLLRSLNELEINNLFGKWKKKSAPWLVRSISDLYSEVTEPKNPIMISSADMGSLQSSVFRTPTNMNSIPTTNLRSSTKSILSNNRRSIPATSVGIDIPSPKRYKHDSVQGRENPIKPKTAYLHTEMPTLYHEPFDERKSSTWLSRHPDSTRLMPDGRIAKGRVRHYRNSEQQRRLGSLRRRLSVHSEKSFGDAEFGDMFGHMPRKSRGSTRLSIKSLPPEKRKS